MSRTAQDIIEIGRELIAVRERLGRVNQFDERQGFAAWIEREFGMGIRTATRFMNVAKNIGSISHDGRRIEITAIYELTAPSTPEEVRTEVAERVAAGEPVTVPEVRALKEKVRHAVPDLLGRDLRPVHVVAV